MPDEHAIRTTVMRLSRPHPSGGRVIERAAVLAVGAHSAAILTWIDAQGGRAEPLAPSRTTAGLHGLGRPDVRRPLRYLIPAVALAKPGSTPRL